MLELYKAIWRKTGRRQLVLIVLSLMVAGLAAVPLEYQKDIINGIDEGFPTEELIRHGLEMAGVILLSHALTGLLGYRAGALGEWVTMRLRTLFCGDTEDQNGTEDSNKEKGTLANMISSEAEVIGKFVGDAVAEPLLQFGTLIIIVGYIMGNQPRLGLFILAIIVPQAIIVLMAQVRINKLVEERVVVLRRSLDEISAKELAEARQSVLRDFEAIYDKRRKIFIWKLSTKFVMSSLNGLGLVGVLVIGGWLALQGKSDVGTVVAATVGLAQIRQPWRLLIAFYRNLSVVRVHFDMIQHALPQAVPD